MNAGNHTTAPSSVMCWWLNENICMRSLPMLCSARQYRSEGRCLYPCGHPHRSMTSRDGEALDEAALHAELRRLTGQLAAIDASIQAARDQLANPRKEGEREVWETNVVILQVPSLLPAHPSSSNPNIAPKRHFATLACAAKSRHGNPIHGRAWSSAVCCCALT